MREFFESVWQMIVDSHLLDVLGAVLILVVGWLVALVVSKKVSGVVRKLSAQKSVAADGMPAVSNADTIAGRVAYYVIMIFAVLGCLSVLELNAAAEPIQEFISTVARYAPNIAGALLLAVAAWIVAGLIRCAVRAALIRSKLNERLAVQMKASDPAAVADYAARTVYYVVFLFFLPAILNALKIYGITQPLQSMFEKVMTYIPNIIAAAAILIIGLWVASVVRKAVSGLVVLSRLNTLGEKAGVSRILGNGGLASMAGITAYVLVAIPVIVSSLTALKIEVLSNSVAGFFEKLLDATGDIIGASLIIFVAVIAGGFAASLVSQLTAGFGLDRFIASLGYKSSREDSIPPSAVAGKIAYVAIVVMAVIAACEVLEFTALANLLHVFVVFGGNLLLSIAVLLIGLWLANFVASVLKGKCPDLAVSGIKAGVILFTVALAVSNMDIGDGVVEIAFAMIIGAIAVAFAIAFGFGGREAAGKLLNDWADKLKK